MFSPLPIRTPRARHSLALCAGVLLALPAAPVSAQERVEPWTLIQPPQASIVLARDGSLIGEIGKELRTSISIRTLPHYVPRAFVAIEDQRFYEHDGVDLIGVGGALKDLLKGETRGASTITQQLVGNMHPEIIDRRDRTLGRKLREQTAAREMERRYTKEQILEAYLNQIEFGHGWFGIETASRHYFGKSASRLTIAEAATIAALPKGPGIYSPIINPQRARERRDLVLELMARQNYITRAQAEAAKREPIRLAPNRGVSARAGYFVDAARAQAERAGIPVANGGYRIFTTLDPVIQEAAVDALVTGATEVEQRAGYAHLTYAQRGSRTDYLQGAVVALDPFTGEVRALVGGRDHANAPFNRAVNALRQPGSAFKPFVYAAALADSIPPNAIVPDSALAILLPNGDTYSPRNADNLFVGPLTIRDALARSRNSVAVQLGMTVGMDTVAALARQAGVESLIETFPSSAIGASAVYPLDFVAAYTAFANLGSAVEPRLIDRIEDRSGRTVWSPPARAPQLVMDPRIAFVVRDMMRDVVERGTATSVRRFLPPSVPAAGKTGTTNDNTDVWFVGMTPELVGGVWLGFDRPKTITPGAGGGSLAAPIWGRMMATIYRDRQAGEWMVPGGLILAELDRETGELATEFTPPGRRYTEYFLEGTEPAAMRPDGWKLFTWGPLS